MPESTETPRKLAQRMSRLARSIPSEIVETLRAWGRLPDATATKIGAVNGGGYVVRNPNGARILKAKEAALLQRRSIARPYLAWLELTPSGVALVDWLTRK